MSKKYLVWLPLALFVHIVSGRANAMEFQKPSLAELKRRLTPLQFEVTQEKGTERPFKNDYWDNKAVGIYVDVVSGEPLFSSLDKFDSGTGWPSFTRPLESANIVLKSDRSLFMTRTEVRSKHADSHLGHVFDDGPKPTGKRYCMNSAALRFIPVAELEKQGYGEYLSLFSEKVEAAGQTSSVTYAVFAGGCFWCMEPPFEKMKGVKAVVSGYAGGSIKNPTYEQVSSGATKHLEVVRVEYDASQVSYEALLEVFWRQIDPTDAGGQFVDRGPQYRTAIFVANAEERSQAEASRLRMQNSGRFGGEIVTEIISGSEFYPAEDYHQDYYKKNPIRYKFYRSRSGRDRYLENIWKK